MSTTALSPLQRSWLRDGTSQDDRMPRPLYPDYFQVDERSFFQLLAQMEQLARSMDISPRTGAAARSWSDYFKHDETIAIGLLMGVDIQALSECFNRALGAQSETVAALEIAFDAARTIETWRQTLIGLRGRAAGELEDRLSRAIQTRLARPFVSLMKASERLNAGFDFSRFLSPWPSDLRASMKNYANLPGESGTRPMSLSVCFAAFTDAMADIAKAARPFFDDSIKRRNHDPAVAMLITYLALLQAVQKRLNRFTALHRDFYYRDVLSAAPRRRRPQRMLLQLIRPPGTSPLDVERGTPFNASVPDREAPVRFRSTTGVSLNNARIAALASVYLERDSSISPESDLGYVSRVRFCEQPTFEAQSKLEAWPLFGQPPSPAFSAPKPAQNFGFAIASPAFHLGEGTRRVDITIQFKPIAELGGEGALDAFVQRELERIFEGDAAPEADRNHAEELRRLFGRLFQALMTHRKLDLSETSRQDLFARVNQVLDMADRSKAVFEQLFSGGIDASVFADKLLGHAFDLAVTGESGWIEITNVTVRPESTGDRDSIRFTFILSEEVPSTAPYDPEIHGGALATSSPVVRCVLAERATFCVYSLFDGLSIADIVIETEVEGCKSLGVANQDASLDPSKPFLAFGPRPSVGDFFSFGSEEIARKRLTRLDVRLTWGDLPPGKGGFAAYYAGYEEPYARLDFCVSAAINRDGQWLQASDSSIELFDSADGEEQLADLTQIRLDDLASWRPMDESEFRTDRARQARDGLVRLTLTHPPTAFGHRTHPTVYAETLAQRLRSRRGVKPHVPNEPYTPVIRSIEMNYVSQTVISLDRRKSGLPRRGEAVFHLHPFGHREVYPNRADDSTTLLPHVERAGNLLIGIKNCPSEAPLTLVFEMLEGTQFRSVKTGYPTYWSVLTTNGWRPLEGRRVIDDTTSSFTTSGIVTLALPKNMDFETTSMPAGMGWLRLSADDGLQYFPGVLSVRAQAVEVEQILDPADATAADDPIPTDAVWQSPSHLPGVTKIQAVGNSFAGRAAEAPLDFYKRINERLRHRQRAVSPWDYERLVLERSPNIWKVKCFANLDARAAVNSALAERIEPSPGHVLVVVIPRPSSPAIDPCTPLMIDQLELESIQRFLQELAPSSAQVFVRNPTYDLIQVRCKVSFDDRQITGAGIRRLQDDIKSFLSPWSGPGYRAGFGWSLRPEQIEGHLISLGYVKNASGLSILQLIETDDAYYLLQDTARRQRDDGTLRDIVPSYPWSVALPFNSMDIEAVPDLTTADPVAAGIGQLELGRSFVIGADKKLAGQQQVQTS